MSKIKNCLNCRIEIGSRKKDNKFCCPKCSAKFHSDKRKVFSHEIYKLNKICYVEFCEEKAVGILNKNFYCKEHYQEIFIIKNKQRKTTMKNLREKRNHGL